MNELSAAPYSQVQNPFQWLYFECFALSMSFLNPFALIIYQGLKGFPFLGPLEPLNLVEGVPITEIEMYNHFLIQASILPQSPLNEVYNVEILSQNSIQYLSIFEKVSS